MNDGPALAPDHPRPVARARRSVVHAAPRRPGRHSDQDRAARERATTRARGVRRFSRTRKAATRRRPRTTSRATAASCRSPSTSPNPKGSASCAISRCRPTCWSRISRWAVSPNTDSTTRASRRQSAPRLRVDHRLRAGRPLRRARRLRLHHPGHERIHERHRRARRSAGRRSAEGGRGDHRPHDRHVRGGGDPGGARASRPHRRGPAGSTWRSSIPRWR